MSTFQDDRDRTPGHDHRSTEELGVDERTLDRVADEGAIGEVEERRIYHAPLGAPVERAGAGAVVGTEAGPETAVGTDPDAEVTSVEDALLRERSDAGWERSGELDTRPARLGGAEGLGVMRVVRSADGAPVSLPGTWRPPAGAAADGRFEAGSLTRYEGPLHLGDGQVEEVSEEVRITSAGTYVTEDGEEYDIVNFEATSAAQPRPR